MSRFAELNDNIMSVLFKLIDNQNLCKLLNYISYDPLAEADIQNTATLLFDKIYPFPFSPDVDTEARSQLNVLFEDFKLGKDNPAFKNNQVTFVIVCHSSLWRISGMLRPFAIMKEIDTLFNSKNVIGIGKMEFSSGNLAWVNEKYSGYRVSYKVYDFN